MELIYKNIEFYFPGSEVVLPKAKDLDVYLSWIDKHQEHIDNEVQEMTCGWHDAFVVPSKSHVACITVESQQSIAVMILGDEILGDLGYDIWFENEHIVNEGFAD